MSKFYTNVYMRGDRIYLRGYNMGGQVKEVVQYAPYLFIPSANGEYRTLDGGKVGKMQFSCISEAREFTKTYEQVDNMPIYGSTAFPYLFIYDNYPGHIDYDPSMVKIASLDIETDSSSGFPNIAEADKEIIAIAMSTRDKVAVFGCGHFESTDPRVIYVKCDNELDLLDKFVQVWHSDAWCPDIVTGWNIEKFDIPYLYNRIKRILGEKHAKKLSPWNMVNERDIIRGKSVNRGGKNIADRIDRVYDLVGISTLDYMELYKKFSFGNQESYKLDYIASVELGERKVAYEGSLDDLYRNDYQKFIEYNIQDTFLVEKLEDKLKFIEQVMALAYDAKVNYGDTMTTVKPWDTIIHNYLLDQGIVIPPKKKNEMTEPLVGGFVKEPKLGLSKWVVSFDLNSLYPHLIMQYNISPETFVSKVDFPSIDFLLEGTWEYRDGSVAYAANGCTYRRDKQGFLPALMEKMYVDRTEYKKKMLDAKKSFEKTKSRDDEKLVARYHNMQLAKKIQLNSAYGALGNEYFRWFNFDHAEAITMSGQLSIRWIEKRINAFFNKLLKTDADYVIASDTDSIYVDMGPLVDKIGLTNDLEIVKALDQFCEQKIQPYIDKCYGELADMMNAYQQKMQMKRETIANKGIWKAKKMYILNAWNVEGVQYDEPKLKLQGIEAVRSSTPQLCREAIKKALKIIMNGTERELRDFVAKFRTEFNGQPFEEVSFPRGIKNLNKYRSASSIYTMGTPLQVKGALLYNHFIKKLGLRTYQPFVEGDKGRFSYLKLPNPIHDTVIAIPAGTTLPEEFNLENYIDYDKQFEKSFLDPLKSITDVIGWEVEDRCTLESFFN